MTGGPDRVPVWSVQLKQRDFPPVCAMSGMPAEVWGHVRFVTAPAWVHALHLLEFTGVGLIPVLIVSAAASRRASGWLPLTRASRRKRRAVVWTATSLFAAGIPAAILGLGLILLAPSVHGPQADFGIRLFLVGLAGFSVGGLALVVVKPRYGPQGNVLDRRAPDLGTSSSCATCTPCL